MAIYQIPVTVLTTGDELLYLESLYISDTIPSSDELKEGVTLSECALTASALTYASNVTYFVPNNPIAGITDNRPAVEVMRDKGFRHTITVADGDYHWIINGQKFLAQVTSNPPDAGKNNYVGSIYIVLQYLSGSYAEQYPKYVGLRQSLCAKHYTSDVAVVYTPDIINNDGDYPIMPSVGLKNVTKPLPAIVPRFYRWGSRSAGDHPKEYNLLLFNIPINQNASTPEEDRVNIGDTYPEYDVTVSGPTSKPINPEDNPVKGDFDEESEPIPPPDIDELNKHSAVNTGLISIYNPTIGEVAQLANFLWSDLFSLDTFKKMFGSPMEAILSLHIIPVTPTTQAGQNVIIGNVNTEITMPKVTHQFVSFNCGAVNIQSFFGSALDFSPFTKMSIFLPYIGVRELNIDEIMYKSVGVQYLFDVLTGACNALITVDGDVRYQYSGSASLQMPINATNWSSVINNIMSLATATIATVASSGAAAGQLLTAGANAVTSSKMDIERSGAVTGAAGFLGVQTPYLIRTIPRQSLAKNYQHYSGYPSNITAQLGSLSGYTEVEQVFLDGVTATEAEKTEILSLLKGGVII